LKPVFSQNGNKLTPSKGRGSIRESPERGFFLGKINIC